jgi:hypothetical protein
MGQETNFRSLKADLPDKLKTVDDIVRFIKNRTDDNPNYSLILGSGSSVSSNIPSAISLIKQWKREIYLLENPSSPESEYSEKKASEYLQKEHAKWYDARNEYASLFEYKYNLPKQRRIFIEQEVTDKKPSIGYAYLVRLIENEYFRTIFTTNFDDLLNYAFYTHSVKCRPVVCAHDSSINSITVTSKRPKIIKLHGDYLFDDIKCTNRETESLQENMKSKFVEFARDYGLIVMGYGGNDRSIMDILNYLLKHENYFTHGIYWCVLDKDETIVSEEVRKLLWKDRVYYVPIAGFDEFFAELSHKLSPDILPYETRLGGDVGEIMLTIKSGEQQFSACEYITSDLSKCIKNVEKTTLSNHRKVIELKSEDKGELSSISADFEEIIKKDKVNEYIAEQQYQEAITEGLRIIETGLKSHAIITELYALIAYCYKRLDQSELAIATLQKIIEINNIQQKGDNTVIRHKIASLINNLHQKIKYLEESIENDSEDYRTYLMLAKNLIKLKNNSIEDRALDTKIIECLDTSIRKNPSCMNLAYFAKFDFLLTHAKNNEDYTQCEQILDECAKQNKFDEDVVDGQVDFLMEKKATTSEISQHITSVKKESPYYNKRFRYDMALLRALQKKGGIEEIRPQLRSMDENYKNNLEYDIVKSEVILKNFCNLSASTQCLQDALKRAVRDQDTRKIKEALIINYLYANDIVKAKNLIDELPKLYAEAKREYEAEYHIENNNPVAAIEVFEKYKMQETFDPSKNFYMMYSFNLLRAGMYDKVIQILKPILEQLKYDDEVLVINYELAKKLKGQTPKYARIHKVQQKPKIDKSIKAACAILLSKHVNDVDYKKGLELTKEAIEEDYSNFYRFKRFPVFKDINLAEYTRAPIPHEMIDTPNLQLVTSAA